MNVILHLKDINIIYCFSFHRLFALGDKLGMQAVFSDFFVKVTHSRAEIVLMVINLFLKVYIQRVQLLVLPEHNFYLKHE